MVDYTFSIPQPYDPSGDIANALRFRQAQQAEAENQLKLRAWMEDRAYQLKQREAAAANAAAEKARKQELLSIYGNFGVTPAVTGRQGVSYSGTGVANDPYATIQNQLVTKGFLPQAQDVVEYKNKMLTGSKTEAEIAKENALTGETKARTAGVLTENDKKKVELRAAQIKEYGDAVLRAGSIDEVNSLIDSHADVLNELGVPPEQAKANFVNLANKVGFEQALMQSSQGAMATQKHLADIAKTEADTSKVYTDIKKTNWEIDNPDYTIQETAQGMVAVNKKDPTDVKPIQLGNQTVMPVNKSQVTNINTNLPASEQAQKDYMTNVAKTREALQSAPATLENIERAKELIPEASKFMGTGGEAYLTAAKFLNNRLGTSINVEGVKSAEELRSRLFMGVMDNLKKMDAQPTGRQQEALQEAIGQLDTDPAALPRVLDILGNSLRSKVDIYNRDVTDAEGRGVKFPYKPQVDLPAQKVVGENTFPNEAAASQILKQRGARPGDRVRVNIGGRTGTFVVE